MPTSEKPRLPHGAKGIDLGEGIIAFAKDKIVFSRQGAREHVTLHFGPATGVLDVHKTWTADDGSPGHQRIYAIRHDDLASLLEEVGPLASHALMRVMRPLDFDDLVRKRIGVIVGVLMSGEDVDAVTCVRRGKLVVDPEKVASRAWMPEYLDELYQLEEGKFFTLVSTRRAPRVVGHGFAIADGSGGRRLLWLSSLQLVAEMRRLESLFQATVLKHRASVDYNPPSATAK